MSLKQALGRIGIMLSLAVAAGLVGCSEDDNPGDDSNPTYNNDPVRIGDLTWTKNISIETPDSWCYDDDTASCARYGRLYTWEAAKSACESMGDGWRLPTRDDWDNLVNHAGGRDVAGKRLKSKSGWNSNGKGTDDYEFSALPGGHHNFDGHFYGAGDYGFWWSAAEDGVNGAYYRRIGGGNEVDEGANRKETGCAVRCSRD